MLTVPDRQHSARNGVTHLKFKTMTLQRAVLSPQTGGPMHPQPTYTPAKAQRLADQHFAQAYRLTLRTHLIDLVAGYGALTGHQLHRLAQRRFAVTQQFAHFERTLLRLCEDDLLQVLPDVSTTLRQDGLLLPNSKAASYKDTRYRVYGLGPIGFPLARRLWATFGRDTRALLPPDSVVHDVFCAEILLRLVESDPLLGALPPGQVALWNDAKETFRCRPDGMLVKYSGDERTPLDMWWLEFCNESWSNPARVQHKLALYRQLHETGHWQEWDVCGFPQLLVVYRARSTGREFAEQVAQLPLHLQTVCGLSLTEVLTAPQLPLRSLEDSLDWLAEYDY